MQGRAGGTRHNRQLLIALAIALAVGAVSAWYQTWIFSGEPARTSDFDPIWFAARTLLDGGDPYAAVGPGRAFDWPWPLYYPLPALIVAAPFSALPLDFARTLFVFLSAALFAFGVALRGGSWARWFVLLSMSWWMAVSLAQWSMYLAASALLPAAGALLIAKPNIGVAVMAGMRRRQDLLWPVAGGIVLLAASFALQPDWVPRWLHALESNTNSSAPIVRPWGWLLLLAAIKWRRPEARVLLALACITKTPGLNDLLLLFLIPVTPMEFVLLALLTHPAYQHSFRIPGDANAGLVTYGNLLVFYLFLPCLLMVLRRPNEGPAPDWLERRIARWPAWLRGRRAPSGIGPT